MTKKPVRLAVAITTVTTFAMSLVVAANSPASASATGCTAFGTMHVNGVTIPGGSYCATVNGFSTYVETLAGSAISSGNLCNWVLQGNFYDLKNQRYWRTSSDLHAGCTRKPSTRYGLYQKARPGKVCIALVSSGVRVAQVCHQIKA